MRRRVVITGMGAITPLGHSVGSMMDAQLAGVSGVDRITHFDASKFPTTFASQVKDFDLAKHLEGTDRWANSGLNSRFAAAATKQALADAGLLDEDGKVDRTRFGVYLGSGEGVQDFHALLWNIAQAYTPEGGALDYALFNKLSGENFHAAREAEQELHMTGAHIASHFGLDGPNFTCLTACAASSQAVGEAVDMIRQNQADVMLAGGAHSMIHPFGVTGFNLLTALSTQRLPKQASRPFDLNRDGFVLGKGAGMVILEELEHAKARGAKIYAEMTGYGSTADAFRVTDSHETGRGAIACIQDAARDSGLAREQIGYINAHGTSTHVNDSIETLAIKNVFGELAYKIPVSSSKSMLGHLIAAAGVVELITCVEVLHRGWLPPTINYDTPDPECDLDYVPNQARQHRADHALSNSFGFGGQNVSLIVSRF